jgi:hypothetical protein
MALLGGFSSARPFPSGRYLKTDPLRREFGLRLLSDPLPEPLRASLIRAWRHPRRFDGNQAIQSLHRQRPSEASLRTSPPAVLDWLTFMELGVSRRVVETPRQSISRETRNKLLASQGVYLAALYRALAEQVGEAAAQAAFERSLLRAV